MKIEVEIKASPKRLEELYKEMVILVDTREKSNSHIIEYFEQNKILYLEHKLEVGDYSFMIPKNDIFHQDVMFTNHMVIERKNSLEEISGNLSNDRTRFENELAEIYDRKIKLYNIVEGGSLTDIMNGNYNTQYHHSAFLASYLSFMDRYNFTPLFTTKPNSGKLIYSLCKYHLRNLIK